MSSNTPEGKVKQVLREKLKAVPGLYYFMPPANGFGRAGVPDFVGCLPDGRFFAIEAKAEGGRLTAMQKRELDKININGVGLVVRGVAEALALRVNEL